SSLFALRASILDLRSSILDLVVGAHVHYLDFDARQGLADGAGPGCPRSVDRHDRRAFRYAITFQDFRLWRQLPGAIVKRRRTSFRANDNKTQGIEVARRTRIEDRRLRIDK